MENKFNLDVHSILEKEFHIDFKGYSSVEVDGLLDQVIEDYQRFDEVVAKLSEVNLSQGRLIASLKAKLIELESKAKVSDNQKSLDSSQMDILKRLARLEKIVYSNMD